MNSRIILSTADFSANNIGRYVELSDFTKKVLAKQTQYDLASEEAIALNTFLTQLTIDGFLGGNSPLITFLAIPGLASQHNQLLYNIASLDGEGYPTQAMAQAELEAQDKYFAMKIDSEGRCIGLATNAVNVVSTQGIFNCGLLKNGERTNDPAPSFTEVIYLIDAIASTSENTITTFESIANSIKNQSVSVASQGVRVLRAVSGLTNGFFGVSYNNSDYDFELVSETGVTLGERTVNGTLPTKIMSLSDKIEFGTYVLASSRRPTAGIIAYSNYMTPTQLTTFKGYVDTLLTAIHTKTA